MSRLFLQLLAKSQEQEYDDAQGYQQQLLLSCRAQNSTYNQQKDGSDGRTGQSGDVIPIGLPLVDGDDHK